jgi:ADP-dependent NAD(P)H-hydrate dehydratase / NAD(P)H-hydrate epimerase
MISGKEIKVLDYNSEFYGIPTIQLMENAGKKTADFIKKELKLKNKHILILCGTGNNGGDGFVAARYLSKNYNVTVFLAGLKSDIKTDISKKNFYKIKNTDIKIFDIKSIKNLDILLEKNEVLIDAMLGIGLTGSLKEPYSSMVKKINLLKNKTIICLDIPTGFGTNIQINPNYTITFHDIKSKMNKSNSGIIRVVDIGIPKKAVEYIGPGELITYYPIPKKDSHKGENGRLLVIGGGPYFGAPALSSFAAQRTGIDLIYVATPKKVARAITSYSPLLIKPVKLAKDIAKLSPTLIVKELSNENFLVSNDLKLIEPLVKKVDALLIGPGLGYNKETQKAVEKIIKFFIKKNIPIAIDADAIKVVGKKHDIIKNGKIVITPHSGEFHELTGIQLTSDLKSRIKTVNKWAKKLDISIVLKGPIDIISDGKNTKLNEIHNEAMTVGGTGDVLAGIIGALLSKKVEPFNAARLGVFLSGSAGNIAFEKRSYGLVATDIIDEIPTVLKKYL